MKGNTSGSRAAPAQRSRVVHDLVIQPFERVVQLHGPMVLRVCRSIVGPDNADDVWSNTFLAAMSSYPQLGSDANVAAWLTTIAHNKSIDWIRAAHRAPTPHDQLRLPPHEDRHHEPTDPDLVRALGSLTDQQMRCVVYHHVAGLSFDEVASVIGISSAAARRSSSDGIAKLRASYLARSSDEEAQK